MGKIGWIILGVVLILVVWFWASYNSFVSLSLAADKQWANVEAQYQRRFDLIPNLVNSVKGVMAQEQKVFGDLAEARTRYSGATTVSDKVAAANQLEGALGRLLVVMENYPQLRSVETVLSLQAELSGTENRISVERMRFNDEITSYNTKVKSFPSNVLAGMFGYKERLLFQAAEGTDKAPAVNF